jgi:hypothetical protein
VLCPAEDPLIPSPIRVHSSLSFLFFSFYFARGWLGDVVPPTMADLLRHALRGIFLRHEAQIYGCIVVQTFVCIVYLI